MRPATSMAMRGIVLLSLSLALSASSFAQGQRLTDRASILAAPYVKAYQAPALGGPIMLYDQVQGTQTSGIVSQNNVTATTFDDEMADDFVVPMGVTWNVTRVFARGFYTTAGVAGTCESGDITFYEDASGMPGAIVGSFSGAPTTDVTGSLTFNFPSITVAGGTSSASTFWVSVVCNGALLDLGVNGRWNWFNNSVVTGVGSSISNPNGGFGLPNAWNPQTTDRDFSLSGATSAPFPTIGFDPASISASVESGSSSVQQLTISNTGDADLDFSFPAFAAAKRLQEYSARGIDVNRREAGLNIEMPKGVEPVTSGGGNEYRTGGPDAGGYVFIDSSEPGGPIPGYQDVSATGTVATFEAYTGCTAGGARDEGRATVALPFPFTFYGQSYTTAYVYPNGVIGFDPAFAACAFSNSATIPNAAGINGFLAPFWDDLNLSVTGDVFSQLLGDGRFVIQFKDVPRFGSAEAGRGNNFEVILSPNGSFTFEYGAINAANQASQTIGIEDQAGSTGLLVNANTAGYAAAGLSIAFSQLPPVVSAVSPISGTVAPGGSTTVDVTLSAVSAGGEPLPAGTYEAQLDVSSNDPATPSASIPVSMDVSVPPFGVNPSPLTSTLAADASGTETLTLSNNTGSEIYYEFPQYGTTRAAPPEQNIVPGHQKDEPDTRPGQAHRDRGGPDGFGYQWIDSNEAGGPAYDWVDISSTGTAVTLSDDGTVTVPLPFTFSFYGADQNSIRIVSNGFLAFGGTSTDWSNNPIPDSAVPNAVIAPYWDDFIPPAGGEIRYQDMGDGRFVVSYLGVQHYAAGAGRGSFTFQAILYASGAIKYQYQEIAPDPLDVNSATVGIENLDGTDGLQLAFNSPYVTDNLAVLIQSRPTFVTGVSAPSGVIPANSSVDVDVTFDAAGLLGGVYDGSIDISAEMPMLGGDFPVVVSLPVQLTVVGTPTITVAPANLAFGDVIVGASASLDVTVSNNGSGDLTVSGVTSDNADFTTDAVTPFVLSPGADSTFAVTFAPTSAAVITGMLSVVSDAAGSPTMVGMTGTGLEPPAFSASPGSFTINTQATRVADAQIMTLSNTGAGAGAYTVQTRQVISVAFGEPYVPTASASRGSASTEKELKGSMPATTGTDYLGGDIVADGGFEGGIPNASWDEASTNFGTPLCDVSGCGLGGGTGPHSGSFWGWFGGSATGDVGSLTQAVTIPAGTATLSFWLEIPTVAGGTGFVAVTLDGSEVFRATYSADQPAYTTYTLAEVDISAYANGASHTLQFHSVTTGSGNFFVDDVAITVEAGILLTATPAAGSVAAGGTQAIDLVADATNADVGTYEFMVVIETNDPANPEISVPVTVNVAPYVAGEEGALLPDELTLYPSYPNPVRSNAVVKYAMPESGPVSISVYDVAGRLVSTLVNTDQAAGFHEAPWDASSVASGVYVVRLQAGNGLRTIRMSVVR